VRGPEATLEHDLLGLARRGPVSNMLPMPFSAMPWQFRQLANSHVRHGIRMYAVKKPVCRHCPMDVENVAFGNIVFFAKKQCRKELCNILKAPG
jgi:hypothetical protein